MQKSRKKHSAIIKWITLVVTLFSITAATIVSIKVLAKGNSYNKIKSNSFYSAKSASFEYFAVASADCSRLEKVTVYNINGRLQDIILPAGSELPEGSCSQPNPSIRAIIVEDINFDGYEDLAIYANDGGAYNALGYIYATYLPSEKIFKLNNSINRLNLRGASFSSYEQSFSDTIKTRGSCGKVDRRFNWDGDQARQIYEYTEECSPESDKITATTKTINEKGELVETKKVEIPVSDLY